MIAYDRLSLIIPADQALANKALQVALQQITNIGSAPLPVLANTVANLETTKDLPLVEALTVAVPSSVANVYINTLQVRANNVVTVSDVLGTMVGYNETDALVQTVELFNEMDLDYLDSVYATMLDVVNGVYDDFMGNVIIPSGTPGAGTYSSRDAAISTGLIPVAQTEIGNLIVNYPTQTTTMNTDWTGMCDQVITEQALQQKASIVFANLTANDKTSVYGLIYGLPQYGLDDTIGGKAEFMEEAADINTFTGQCIVAAMREGRNQVVLGASAVVSNSNIPAEPDPPPPQANLIPSTYTASQAGNLVIR